VVNVIVSELAALERFLSDGAMDGEEPRARARVHRLPISERSEDGGGERPLDAEGDTQAEVGSSMRAVVPPVQSFAMGRRR
jgi:hypothetical protein